MLKVKNSQPFVLMSFAAVLFSCQPAERIELKLNPLFSDHMVLQQQDEVSFWGQYTSGQEVSVSASWGSESIAIPNEKGNWNLNLPTPAAGGPFEITIHTTDSTVSLQDVMIGEVWIASGQSNMEMSLRGYLPNEPIDNNEEEIANANYPGIRMFTVEHDYAISKQHKLNGDWQICSPENAAGFSATGYFFARRVHNELDLPVGIIHTSWGGTEAEAWTSKEGLVEFPEFIEEIESFDETEINAWVDKFESVSSPNSLEEFERLDLNDAEILADNYDNSQWPEIQLPHGGCKTDDFIPDISFSNYLNGAFWYRKTFNIENTDTNYLLVIGAIDDADVTYVNGHKVGATLNWQEERNYIIPASYLEKGENVVVIKQYDSGGGSAINGPIYVTNDNGNRINLEGTWSGLFYADLKNQDLIIYGIDHQHRLVDRPRTLHIGPNQLASSLFNAMIHPLVPYNIRGAIWYQGESNVGRAAQYEQLFPAMIEDWRAYWNREFPFYFVQIAPFSYGNELSPALRDAQRKSLTTPKTGMAIAMDMGHPTSIHPGNKQDVGSRLARLALANDYGRDVVASGPLYKGHLVKGAKLLLEFEYAEAGLMAKNSDLSGFEIAGRDKQFVTAEAIIVDDKIEVSSAVIPEPVYVRYGWKDYIEASLFNSAGLPASSFTSEE